MPILNLNDITPKTSCNYPDPHNSACEGRSTLQLSLAGGLTQFGANLVTLEPGVWASQRHHHSAEDELVYIVSGHPSFIDDDGERQLSPGDVTVHPRGDGNGHHMINRTDKAVQFLVIGTKNAARDHVHYPDVDLELPANGTPQRIFRKKSEA